jgi:hypothetical protein
MTLRAACLCLAMAVAAPARAAPCPAVDPALAGFYLLEGAMEVGSQLVLRPDGRFDYMLAYGAIDQIGSGCWSVSGSTLALRVKGRKIPAQASPVDRRFRGMYLLVRPDGTLAWPLAGFRGRYARQ